jgi:hypothetical protein
MICSDDSVQTSFGGDLSQGRMTGIAIGVISVHVKSNFDFIHMG